MRYTKLYAHLIAARGSLEPTPDRWVKHRVFPGPFGGRRDRENEVYLTPREALVASAMLLRLCPGEVSRSRVARGIGNLLDRLPRTRKTSWIRRAIRRYAGERPVSDIITLYHHDGRSVSGTRQQLALSTGIDYDRIRDLIAGRRGMARGWSASRDRAKQGPAKRGPKSRDGFDLFL